MTKAVRIEKTGGPEVMQLVAVDLAKPEPGEVRIKQTAIGLNYIDTYHRSGLYPVKLPSGLGLEAAGVVEDVGQGVTSLKVGDRVAYGNGPIGAYAQATKHCGRARRQNSRNHKRPDRRRHDVEGHNRALSPARHLQGQGR